jgi:hypothetical protein
MTETLDLKIKAGILILKETRLKAQREEIVTLHSNEASTHEETVRAIKNLRDIEKELFAIWLDLELMGIEVVRPRI